MTQYPRLVVAGTHSGVGKTTVTLALLAALRRRGREVQSFKVGPDFIDTGHHTVLTGRPSRNLDGWMLDEATNREIFARAAADADLSIIEGMMGLFDGSSPVSEIGSTAELAKQLGAPVLLVIDGSAMARSVAAIASGYARFDPDLPVASVLFNRVSSKGHYELLKAAIEAETNLIVVGYLRPDPSFEVPDRHLGLVTALEQGSTALYDRLAAAVAETVDLNRVEQIAYSARVHNFLHSPSPAKAKAGVTVRVGIAYDPAFCFYYEENLELLKNAGAELVKFSPLNDQALPEVELLYLGGGYPELYGERLARNVAMRQAIRSFSERGGAIYAECGGLMYLTRAVRDFEGRTYEMVGLFPAEATMSKTKMTLAYRHLEVSKTCLLGQPGMIARGHEFHYSTLEPTGPLHYACSVTDAQGKATGLEGLVSGNTLALYTHLHFASQPQIAQALVVAAQQTAGYR
jgi:cobyrinic acid a,c-diamide synthase